MDLSFLPFTKMHARKKRKKHTCTLNHTNKKMYRQIKEKTTKTISKSRGSQKKTERSRQTV